MALLLRLVEREGGMKGLWLDATETVSCVPSVKTQVSFNKFAVENTAVHESR